jgi:hypothetical protein
MSLASGVIPEHWRTRGVGVTEGTYVIESSVALDVLRLVSKR